MDTLSNYYLEQLGGAGGGGGEGEEEEAPLRLGLAGGARIISCAINYSYGVIIIIYNVQTLRRVQPCSIPEYNGVKLCEKWLSQSWTLRRRSLS